MCCFASDTLLLPSSTFHHYSLQPFFLSCLLTNTWVSTVSNAFISLRGSRGSIPTSASIFDTSQERKALN